MLNSSWSMYYRYSVRQTWSPGNGVGRWELDASSEAGMSGVMLRNEGKGRTMTKKERGEGERTTLVRESEAD